MTETPGTNKEMIALHGVSKNFQEVSAVNNVNLTIHNQNTVVIFGHSGSGKTTLLRLIAGLLMPDSGEIYIDDQIAGTNQFNMPPYERKIGYVFQTPALWPHMTIKQNIMFGMEGISPKESEERLEELLEKLDIQGVEKKYPGQISGGQAKRVALARTLAPKPKILLLDEPLSNIDMELKEKILDYIKREVKKDTKAIVYVTHDQKEAEEIGDRIVKMRGGCIEK